MAGLRPDSPQKNAGGVMGEENFGWITLNSPQKNASGVIGKENSAGSDAADNSRTGDQVTQATHGQARRCLRVALILFTGNFSEENRHSFRRNFGKNLNSFGFRKNQNSFRKFFGKIFKSFGNRLTGLQKNTEQKGLRH